MRCILDELKSLWLECVIVRIRPIGTNKNKKELIRFKIIYGVPNDSEYYLFKKYGCFLINYYHCTRCVTNIVVL